MDIRVKQTDTTDCGPACLASVARFFGYKLPIAAIRRVAGTDKSGTNLLGMVEAARSFGFEAKGVRGDFQNLSKIPLPAIAHTQIGANLHHYVVISHLSKNQIIIMDPSDGEFHKKNRNEFIKEWTGILVLIQPTDDFVPKNSNRSTLNRLWTFLWPHRYMFIQAVFAAILFTILGLSTSILIQQIVDHVIPSGNYRLLNVLCLGMVILLLIKISTGVFKDILIMRTGHRIDRLLILGYYKHLLKLPQQFFDTMRVGEITSRINDAVKIRLFINDMSINLLISLLMLVSSLILMFTYYWKLATIMLLIIPVYALIYFITNKLNKHSQRKMMEDSAELESQLVESLNSIRTIKSFALEDMAGNKTEARFMALIKTVYRSGLNTVFSGTSTEFTSQFFTLLLLWIGTIYVLKQELSSGELLSFYSLISFFTAPVSSFIGTNKLVQDALIAADRLFEIMDLQGEDQSETTLSELKTVHFGNIHFRDVTFRYGMRANVFSNFNMEIPLRKMTGIVGESGSGKSTLIALLHKLYPLTDGSILIGNQSIKSVSNNSIRKMIGVIPQTIDLFSGTVLYNITIGMEDVDMKKVSKICAKLGISEFIESLPDGFHTNVGERGLALSGGQKQRMAIARALYRNPEILILDEATSSLDPLSEKYVMEAIRDFLSQQKTVIIIAHKLSTIQSADKIILLKDGVVREEGEHTELIALRAEYYSLWTKSKPLEISL